MMTSSTPMTIFLAFTLCEASGPGHQLLEELCGSRRTGDLEGNRPAVALGRHGEPKKPTALPLGIDYPRELGQESLGRREGPAEAIGHWNASDGPGHESGQELRAARLKLRGREGTGDRKVGHTRFRRKTWVARTLIKLRRYGPRSQRHTGPSSGSATVPRWWKPHFRSTRVDAFASGKVCARTSRTPAEANAKATSAAAASVA